MGLSRIEPGALAASVAAHAVLVVLASLLWSSRPREAPTSTIEVAIEEPTKGAPQPGPISESGHVSAPQTPSRPQDRPPPVVPPGAHSVARPDVGQRGKGGSLQAQPATNLASSVDPLTLERDPPNHLRESEVTRVRSAQRRRSWDDRRATPHPMELDFVASGPSLRPLRRPLADVMPAAGTREGAVPVAVGGVRGSEEGEGFHGKPGTDDGGQPSAALGVFGAHRGELRMSAPVPLARPLVPGARAAVPAADRDRPSDTIDSRQRVAGRVAALLQASTLGGEGAFETAGGESGPTPPAAGQGTAQGSRAQALGRGSGLAELSEDPELTGFYRGLRARVGGALRDTFPDWAKLEGRGGLVVFQFVLDGSGRIAQLSLVRPSGIEEFDRNVLTAVRRLSSFGRVPSALAARPIRFSYDERNPAVGRQGPGPGRVTD